MYIYEKNNKMYFNLNTIEKTALTEILTAAFKAQKFCGNDINGIKFYNAVELLKNCAFMDFMDYTCPKINIALYVILNEYFMFSVDSQIGHTLDTFFWELKRYCDVLNKA